MRKIFIIAVAGLMTCTAVHAQSVKQEVSVTLSGGLSTLDYKTNVGKRSSGAGGSLGANYNYYLTSNWSILTGAELSYYNSKYKINEINDVTLVSDDVYNNMEYRNRISNFEEKQNMLYLNIPIMGQFESPIFDNHLIYVAAGLKLNIPVYKKYKIESMDMYNRGFYSDINGSGYELDEPEFRGFGHFEGKDVKGNIKTQISLSSSVEGGMKWAIKDMFLYTGVFCDYGITKACKKENTHLINYNDENPQDLIHSGALNSVYTKPNLSGGKTNESLVRNAHLLSLGIKLRLAFNI